MIHRPEQMSSSIQKELQERLIRGLQDPRVSGIITITGVRVTEDLATAVISVSVLPEEKQDLTLHGLRSSAKFLRREVGEKIDTRQLPEFIFKLDASLKKQASIFTELDRVRQDRERLETTTGSFEQSVSQAVPPTRSSKDPKIASTKGPANKPTKIEERRTP